MAVARIARQASGPFISTEVLGRRRRGEVGNIDVDSEEDWPGGGTLNVLPDRWAWAAQVRAVR
jgi:hypothetical protein